MRDVVSHPYNMTGKITDLMDDVKIKDCEQNGFKYSRK
jgi:hypothetical protein